MRERTSRLSSRRAVNSDAKKAVPPGILPLLPPPPRTPVKVRTVENYDPTVENILKKRVSLSGRADDDDEKAEDEEEEEEVEPPVLGERAVYKRDSQESPSTPLFDDDVSQPLEEFPKRCANRISTDFSRFRKKFIFLIFSIFDFWGNIS